MLSAEDERIVAAPDQEEPPGESPEQIWGDVGEVWKAYGDVITDMVCGLWNAARHPIDTAKGVYQGGKLVVEDPVGALRAIGRQIADDFTSGDPRKAGKLVGQVILALAGTEVSVEKLAALLPKVEAAAAGEVVKLTPGEVGILQKVMGAQESMASKEGGLIKGAQIRKADAVNVERMSGGAPPDPEFPNANPKGYTKNCINCAIATDATLAGRPASALFGKPVGLEVLEKEFGGKFQPVRGPGDVRKILSESGNGARGIVAGESLTDNPGHVFNVVNDNGKIRFIDGQKGDDGIITFHTHEKFQLLITCQGTK